MFILLIIIKAEKKKEPVTQSKGIQELDDDYYPMPQPGKHYGHQDYRPHNYPPQDYPQGYGYGYPPPHEFYPPPPPGYGPGYPPPPGYGYGYPPPGYGYPPPPPHGYPPHNQGNPVAPNPAFLSSPTQNPSQTIRIPGNPNPDYNNPFYPPSSPNPYAPQKPDFYPEAPPEDDIEDVGGTPSSYHKPSSNYRPPKEGDYYTDDQSNTPGTASPNPLQNTSKMSKDELMKQAKEQPLLFLDNCINETRYELEPLVNTYGNMVNRHPNGKPMTKELEQSYLKASELLMQKLLLVDQVMAGDNEEIRMKRKTAVKLIQGLIDKLDASKSDLKQKLGK